MTRTYGLPAGTLGALLVGASEAWMQPDAADAFVDGDRGIGGGLPGLDNPEGAERVILFSRGGVRVAGPLVLG